MRLRPSCVLFDVLGTLFTLDRPRHLLMDRGLPREAFDVWFNRVLRDGLALDATATFVPFEAVARECLQVLTLQAGWPLGDGDLADVMAALRELDPVDDAAFTLSRLAAEGVTVGVVSNGGRAATSALLARAGLERYVAHVVGIDDVGHWKPRPEVYTRALEVVGHRPRDVALVAAHAWDLHGAHEVGLTTGWVGRLERRYSATMARPHVHGRTLADVVAALLALPAAAHAPAPAAWP